MAAVALSGYRRLIAEDVDDDAVDPRHVEAFMRIHHPTLDNLSPEHFRREARESADAVREIGPDEAESFAQTMGI